MTYLGRHSLGGVSGAGLLGGRRRHKKPLRIG